LQSEAFWHSAGAGAALSEPLPAVGGGALDGTAEVAGAAVLSGGMEDGKSVGAAEVPAAVGARTLPAPWVVEAQAVVTANVRISAPAAARRILPPPCQLRDLRASAGGGAIVGAFGASPRIGRAGAAPTRGLEQSKPLVPAVRQQFTTAALTGTAVRGP
jgi:hypothetical protein